MEELGARVIDGATDAGVMQLIGRPAGSGVGFPLIGVAAIGNVAVPGRGRARRRRAEPNHSHFVLVAGEGWGETPWIARLASALAAGEASVTLVVNGGEISWADLSESIAEGRAIVAVAGSGGTADAVVAHLPGPRRTSEQSRSSPRACSSPPTRRT